jgi:hypothetical protein
MDSEWSGVVENDGQRRLFLGWTPDRDSQFDDELMRVEAQSRFGNSVGSSEGRVSRVCGCVGGVGQGDLRSSRVAQDCGRGFVDWRGLGFGRYWALASERRALAVADDERGSFLISVQIAESGRHAAGSNNGLKVLTGVSVMCVMSCLLLLLLSVV